jgi:hypothetical protein
LQKVLESECKACWKSQHEGISHEVKLVMSKDMEETRSYEEYLNRPGRYPSSGNCLGSENHRIRTWTRESYKTERPRKAQKGPKSPKTRCILSAHEPKNDGRLFEARLSVCNMHGPLGGTAIPHVTRQA